MLLVSPASTLNSASSGRLIAFAAMAVFLAAMIGILLRPLGYLSIFWPANQLLLVMLLRYPRQLLQPIALLVIFCSYVVADMITGSQLWITVGFTAANMLGACSAWWLLRRQSTHNLQMEGQYSALLVFYASGVASLVSSVIGAPISSYAFDVPIAKALLMWGTGEWMNAMILLPFFLALPTAHSNRFSWSSEHLPALVLPALAVVLLEAASYTVGSKVGSLAFSLPALLWCALTYPILVTAIITMLVFATKIIIASAGFMDFTPEHYGDAATLRLGITMLILGPLSVAGAHAARSELLKRLRHQANHDGLTDVLSRNGFVQTSTTVLKRLAYDRSPVAVLMLDLDHFKRVNDSFGHASGDQLLRDFTATLTQALRPQDVLGRIGGEEFAVVLPQISATDTATIAERLCHAVRNTTYQTAQLQPMRATVSIGVAYITHLDERDSIETLLRDADAALYQAKAQGRDRVVLGPKR
ncbi:MAG: diguanylate cyclase [Comamonas sp.]